MFCVFFEFLCLLLGDVFQVAKRFNMELPHSVLALQFMPVLDADLFPN